MYGPFHLKVSQEAEKTEFDSLPEEEKNILSQMHRCDPERHDIYVFFISPKYLLNFSEDNSPKLTRKQKKTIFPES